MTSLGKVRRLLAPAPVCLALLLWLLPAAAWCETQTFTLWPLLDYRASTADDYSNLGVVGPLFKYETHRDERRYGLRPFFYQETGGGLASGEVLYPVVTWERSPSASSWQFLHLVTFDFGSDESGSKNEWMAFPFLFYGEPSPEESYFALFPLGGKLLGKYGRDRIEFALFPLYSRTQKGGTENLNLLWPIFTRTSGEQESGWALWPLYGQAAKDGVYRRRFFLWPFFHASDQGLDTANPRHIRAFFPFYVQDESPLRTSTDVLWPFFSHIEDFQKDYEEWNFPWPLIKIANGADRRERRFLPFYADSRRGANHDHWYLWPVYKTELTEAETFSRQRARVLFFLYSDLTETSSASEEPTLRRIALWPLFTYERRDGVARFSTLALLEPFFPENERIERSWAPLWRLYQHRWNDAGDEVTSLLWNLYWQERRGKDLAFELFPLLAYRREEAGAVRSLSVLKGLYRYERNVAGTCVTILYLPWGVCHAAPPVTAATAQDQEP